jgi:predicted acetyltransferase
MITLPEEPHLVWPTTAVRVSYLTGEQADCLVRGIDTKWLGPASEDFDAFVEARRSVHIEWDVPRTIFWYISGEHYLGTLVVRHELTEELNEAGGHVGYHVVAPWRGQGHAKRMLAAGLAECRALGLPRVLLTCTPDNEPSRRTILANGGVPDRRARDEDRFWITL